MSQHATVTALRPGPRTIDQLTRIAIDFGKCAGQPNDKLYFPNRTITPDEARAACAGCPVIKECLEMALRLGLSDGIFGGTTPEQRAEILQLEQAVA